MYVWRKLHKTIKIDSKKQNCAGIFLSKSTPLHFVVDYNLGYINTAIILEIFKNIFEVEENKNPKDDLGNTPLHFASKDHRKIEICKLILENIVDKNPENNSLQ